MENRREFPRLETSFQIKYYPLSNNSQFGYTIANDVSRGGLSMPALSTIAKDGDIVKMDINNRDAQGAISITGKVKWASMLTRKGLLDEKIGVEFIDIVPADIDRLVKVH